MAVLRAARRVLQKKLGFRYRMDLTPIEDSGVKGTHGRIYSDAGRNPVIASQNSSLIPDSPLHPTEVYDVIFSHLRGGIRDSSVKGRSPRLPAKWDAYGGETDLRRRTSGRGGNPADSKTNQ